MRILKKCLTAFFIMLATVAVLSLNAFATDVITGVDTSAIVTETKFLYSGDTTNGVWSSNTSSVVENPTFYSKLTVSVNNGEYESLGGFTWVVPKDYDAAAIGREFTFTAVAPEGYEFAEGVAPTITAEIVDGAVSYNGIRGGIITNHEKPVNIVLKDNKIYDATGCNLMYEGWSSDGRFLFGAGLTTHNTGLTRTDVFKVPEYDTHIYATGTIKGGVAGGGVAVDLTGNTYVVVENATLTGNNTGQVHGGGLARSANTTAKVSGDTHVTISGSTGYNVLGAGWSYVATNDTSVSGNTYITITDSTFTNVFGGGNAYGGTSNVAGTANITISDSKITNVYGGGFANNRTDAQANVGSANIDISGDVTINKISGAGYNNGKGTTNVIGTVTVNIHDLAETATIGTIVRGSASKASAAKLIVKLDETSAHLVDKIQKFGVDANIQVYVCGEEIKYNTPTFEIAEKTVNVTVDTTYSRINNTRIFLNGIPTVVAGDGKGHSYLYLAKTYDGTLDVYQKNADGTFKYDENGRRISNIVRDPVTGQAIRGPKLLDRDVTDDHIYGGANGKSVEDVYIEFHQGGTVFNLYGGCLGGNTGYSSLGDEVGLIELRMFGGAVFSDIYLSNRNTESSVTTVNTKCTKSVFIGIDGLAARLSLSGFDGTIGSKERFMEGYYTKAGEVISFTDEYNQTYEITGVWEDYNLDIEKEDYTEYYESTNAYFNGEGNTDFLQSKYYVDPYDDHYTAYALIGNFLPQYVYTGTKSSTASLYVNRTFGNQYLRHSAYGLKYDKTLDMFVEDYNNYKGYDATVLEDYAGSKVGQVYGDVRLDLEGAFVKNNIYPLGDGIDTHFGHVYINLYEEDELFSNKTYSDIVIPERDNFTIKTDFYPRWSLTSAWALDVDEIMPQLAIDKGYISEVSRAKDVRIHMLSATDAAQLLNYYYTGTEEYITQKTLQQTEGYQRIYDASDDAGKFTIRVIEPRISEADGMKRFTNFDSSRPGDCVLMTMPNGATMVVDGASSTSRSILLREIRYYLESAKNAGINDGKTLDYVVLTHWHGDHYGAIKAMIENFDVRNVVILPFEFTFTPYVNIMNAIDAKNAEYAERGEPEINIIRAKRDMKFVIGEGEEAVEVHFLNPGDGSFLSWDFDYIKSQAESGNYESMMNPISIAAKMTYKGQSFIWGGDMSQDAERSIVRQYGEEFLDCDVLKFNHHGYGDTPIWMNACDPEVVVQTLLATGNPTKSLKYCEGNNTGGFAEEVYKDGRLGSIKVVLDGEKIVADTQLLPRAYEKNTQEYKNLCEEYEECLGRVIELRSTLSILDSQQSPEYNTPYITESQAEYIDSQLEELAKRYYLAGKTGDMIADYLVKLENLETYIDDAVIIYEKQPAIVLTDSMVNYRLRCKTAVVDGNLVLTADPAGTSSMKVRLGNLPEGATLEFVETNSNASMADGIITVTNPGMKNVEVPMVITSADGVKTEFVLVADFDNAIRYATYARLSQTGNNITVTSGAATAYVLFDTTDIEGGYVEVTDVSRNLLGRYVVSGSAVRFYNPVYDDGKVTVNVKNANGETVETYSVTAIFADATKYTAVLDTSLRCTYEVDGDNITVTADAGVSNVYLNFGRYYSESLSASVNNDVVKKMGARSWRVMKSDTPIEFDLYFDATAYGADTVTRHVIVNF